MKSYRKILIIAVSAWLSCLFAVFFGAGPLYAENPVSQDTKIQKPFVSKPSIPKKSETVRSLSAMKSRNADKAVPRITAPRFPVFDKKVQYKTEDPLARKSKARRSSKTPAPYISFEGLDALERGYTYPPDTVGDVGPDHYVQMVNIAFAVFDKSGNILTEETPINALWEGEDCVCAETNDGDPIVLYDSLADRWLLSQMSVRGGGNYMCIAVSQTSDPTGAYYLYDFEVPEFPDYPKFGVWPDAYYMSSNEYPKVGAFAFDRNRMLGGLSATFQKFQVERNFMLPSELDGSMPPPAGSPNYFYTVMDDTYWPSRGFPGKDRIEIWEFHADFSDPDNSSFTHAYDLETADFNYNLCGGSRECIPLKDTDWKVDSISEYPMWRLQYRNFGTHETLVGNFTVDIGDFTDHAGIRWFELRKKESSHWAIRQEGTHSPDKHHRWMGSIAMDGAGNIGLGYSVSSEDMYPSIRYAARFADDPPGTLRDEAVLIDGGGSQTGGNRWGDYSSMNADPAEPCTFWYTNEYYETSSDSHWQTRIGSFKIPECTEPQNGILRGIVTGADGPAEKIRIDAGAFTAFTDSDGFYILPGIYPGDYELTLSCYGYETLSENVSIAEGETTTRDFKLTSLPRTTVSGTVTDGSDAGWPLYAGIKITSPESDITVFTNPVTGFYSVELVQDTEYSFIVNPAAEGYESETRAVTPGSGSAVEDFALIADCTAPGYAEPIFFEYFNSCELPEGWEIVNAKNEKWKFDLHVVDENRTGGTGCFAYMGRTDKFFDDMSAELRTPVIDCSDLQSVLLAFKYDFKTYPDGTVVDVDISDDFGKTWDNVWHRSGDDDSGNAKIDISSQAAGKSDIIIRFNYNKISTGYYWQIDDVKILSCKKPDSGGLVVGHVYDASSQDFIDGAAVEDEQGYTAFTSPTPEDPNIDDGFYISYLPSGSHSLSVLREPYDKVVHTVEVKDSEAVQQDFEVTADEFPDYALWFDGQDYYADMGKNKSLNLTGSLTVEAWIYPSGRKGELPVSPISIVDKGRYGIFIKSSESFLDLNDNCLVLYIFHIGYDYLPAFIYTPENSILPDTWQHVAVTYDGIGDVKMYINGIEQKVSYKDDAPSGAIVDSEKSLLIGGNRAPIRAFRGKIDEIRIWNVVRTHEEIKAMMHNSLEGNEPGLAGYWPMTDITGSVLKDKSGNDNDGIINDAAWAGGAPVDLFIDETTRVPKKFKITDYSASSIEMSWEPPSYTADLQGYNILQNNVKINSEPVTQTVYSDENIGYETYCYKITAVYSDGKESDASDELCVSLHNPIIFVNAGAQGENNGSSWTDAFTDLQKALKLAEAGDEIRVAAGIYKPDCDTETDTYTGDRQTCFRLKNNVALYGGFAGTETGRTGRDRKANETVLSGDIGIPDDVNDNSFHVVCVEDTDSTAILDGFTVSGGNGDKGGGIHISNSSPAIFNVTFSHNSADTGGGAMHNTRSSPVLYNVVFSDNHAGKSGGAVSNYFSSPEFLNVKFADNSAQYGGGIYNGQSSPKLNNAVFTDNSAEKGGGMYNYSDSSPALSNVTFGSNSAGEYGGGIYNGNRSFPEAANTIFWENSAGKDGDQIYDRPPDKREGIEASVSSVTDSIVQGGWPGEGNLDKNPGFENASEGNLRLQPGSPAIDTGNRSALLTDVSDIDGDQDTDEPFPFDIAGNPRIVGNAPDMGAFEYDPGQTYFRLSHAVSILKMLAGIRGDVLNGLDINGDARISMPDVICILQYISSLR